MCDSTYVLFHLPQRHDAPLIQVGVFLQVGIPAKQRREVEQSLGHNVGGPVDANANVGHVSLTELLPL